jgi:glycosyltransferase involved in cell wall biosynthesis
MAQKTADLATPPLTRSVHRPLKVHFVVTSLPVGGAETLLVNLVQGMDRTNFSPEVICLKEAGQLGPVVSEFAPLTSNLICHKWDARVHLRLTRHFRQRGADAVITVGAGDKMFWGRLAAWHASVPVICSALHSTGWPDGIGRLNRCLTAITDGFIAVARNHAQHLIDGEKFPEDRVFMIPNGIDVHRFCPDRCKRDWLRLLLQVPENCPLVGIVAALRKEKNHAQFIDAAVAVISRHPNAHFVIVGDGPERTPLEQKVQGLDSKRHFHFLGNRNDTHHLLAGLDVFCLTSLNEANPVSILEALSCGIPVVSPDVGSISETVICGKTGHLTRCGCADSTANAVIQLLNHPELASRMGAEGRKVVAANWSLKSMVDGYEALIEKLYRRKAAARGLPEWQRVQHSFADSNDCSDIASQYVSSTALQLPTGLLHSYSETSQS